MVSIKTVLYLIGFVEFQIFIANFGHFRLWFLGSASYPIHNAFLKSN
jgi:hypothetical protein